MYSLKTTNALHKSTILVILSFFVFSFMEISFSIVIRIKDLKIVGRISYLNKRTTIPLIVFAQCNIFNDKVPVFKSLFSI